LLSVRLTGEQFKLAVFDRQLIFDGGIGTTLLGKVQVDGFVDLLNLENPDLVSAMHSEFITAGADVITTNSFCCLESLISNSGELALAAAQIARKAAHGKLVAGSLGPGFNIPTHKDYEKTVTGLVEGGCDFLIIESVTDLKQAEIALEVIDGVLPVGVTFVDAPSRLPDFELQFTGVNCGAEPSENELKKLSKITDLPLAFFPAAGSDPTQIMPADEWAKVTADIASRYKCNLVGGCCGTSPEYIEKLIVEII